MWFLFTKHTFPRPRRTATLGAHLNAEKSESFTHFTTDCLLRIGSLRAVVSSVNFSSSSPACRFHSEDAIFHSRIENILLSSHSNGELLNLLQPNDGDGEGQTGNHYTLISRFACPLADWLFTTGGTEQQPSVGVRKLIGGSFLEGSLLVAWRIPFVLLRFSYTSWWPPSSDQLLTVSLSLSLSPYGSESVCSSRQKDLQDSIQHCSGTTKQLLPICVYWEKGFRQLSLIEVGFNIYEDLFFTLNRNLIPLFYFFETANS